jgi:hypothetical protein
MPRRRPSAIRAERAVDRPKQLPPVLIPGLSPSTSMAIRVIELADLDYSLFTGATRIALGRYRRFLAVPGSRPLYPEPEDCGCRGCSLDDVRHARDVLELALTALKGRARSELHREVRRLDAVYLRRTLPDPRARQRNMGYHEWWYDRLVAHRGTPLAS